MSSSTLKVSIRIKILDLTHDIFAVDICLAHELWECLGVSIRGLGVLKEADGCKERQKEEEEESFEKARHFRVSIFIMFNFEGST